MLSTSNPHFTRVTDIEILSSGGQSHGKCAGEKNLWLERLSYRQGIPTLSVVIPETAATMNASFGLNTIAATMTTEAINVSLN